MFIWICLYQVDQWSKTRRVRHQPEAKMTSGCSFERSRRPSLAYTFMLPMYSTVQPGGSSYRQYRSGKEFSHSDLSQRTYLVFGVRFTHRIHLGTTHNDGQSLQKYAHKDKNLTARMMRPERWADSSLHHWRMYHLQSSTWLHVCCGRFGI